MQPQSYRLHYHAHSPSLRGLLLCCFSSSTSLSSSAFWLLSFISSSPSATKATSACCVSEKILIPQYNSDTGMSAYEFGNVRSNSFIILTTFLRNVATSVAGLRQADSLLRNVLRCAVKKRDFGRRFSSLIKNSLELQPQALAMILTVSTIQSSFMADCWFSKNSVAGKHRLDVKSRMISSGVLVSSSWSALNPSLTWRGLCPCAPCSSRSLLPPPLPLPLPKPPPRPPLPALPLPVRFLSP